MGTEASMAQNANQDSLTQTTGSPPRSPSPADTVATSLPAELAGTRGPLPPSRPGIIDQRSARLASLPVWEEDKEEWRLHLFFFLLSFLHFCECSIMEGEINVTSELPSMAPGDMASTDNDWGSTTGAVRYRALTVNRSALVTMDTGPGLHKARLRAG